MQYQTTSKKFWGMPMSVRVFLIMLRNNKKSNTKEKRICRDQVTKSEMKEHQMEFLCTTLWI